MIDFHTHILHGMDDGSDSIEASVRMLEKAYRRGTDVAVLTPHCYPKTNDDIIRFVEYRNESFEQLKKACTGKRVPEMLLGAEVNICSPFAELREIHKLCIENTDYMLVEMPAGIWTDWMIDTVYNLTLKGIKPIIAHIDRYINFPKSRLEALDECKPLYQVNADAFLTSYGRRVVLEFYKRGMIHILGSDVHNGKVRRKNTLCNAYIKLEENFGPEYLEFIRHNGKCVLENRDVCRKTDFPKTIKNKFFF